MLTRFCGTGHGGADDKPSVPEGSKVCSGGSAAADLDRGIVGDDDDDGDGEEEAEVKGGNGNSSKLVNVAFGASG